jgi:hypothetical protein
MSAHGDLFSAEILGIIRAGEQRGELGAAAQSAAAGLDGRVLEPRRAADVDLDALLENAGDARYLHLEPSGRMRLRTAQGLFDVGPADVLGLARALARRAGIARESGSGAFLWRDRLLRVVIADTPAGAATVVRLSGAPLPEPDAGRAWREGRPGLLLVTGGRHADTDAALRGLLAAWPADRTKRVPVDLPVDDVVCVDALEDARAQDPDVVLIGSSAAMDATALASLAASAHVAAATNDAAPSGAVAHRVWRV